MAEQWRFFGSTLQDIHSQLGSTCHATLLNGIKYTGYLYSVDPETYTALLLLNRKKESDGNPPHSQSEKDTTETALNKEGAWTMVAVRQHAIKSWECSESTSSNRLSLAEMDTLAHIAQILGDLEEINARKDRLVALLRSKRIPVETSPEDSSVHIMNCAHVRPPYVGASIDCTNVVIRERIKGMIQEL